MLFGTESVDDECEVSYEVYEEKEGRSRELLPLHGVREKREYNTSGDTGVSDPSVRYASL